MTANVQSLTPLQIRELRRRLEAERAACLAEYEHDQERERAIAVDEIGDVVDRAEAAVDRETLLTAAEDDRERLRMVDEALRRIGDGTYGFCLAGGEAIPLQRLRVVPWARLCADHQERLEAGLRGAAAWRPRRRRRQASSFARA